MSNGVTIQELDPSLQAMVNANRVRVQEVLVNVTTAKNIATLTPAAASNFLVGIYFRVATSPVNVTVVVTYTDVAGAQTTTMVNTQAFAIGSYSLSDLFINASSGAAITVTVTASIANQVFVSSTIVEV
jgi:hypothetical protein